MSLAAKLAENGYVVCPFDAAVTRWAAAAAGVATEVLQGDGERRHGRTWFVGVDALPNAADGSIGGVPLAGGWRDLVPAPKKWHRAQLSVVFPGYPQRDADESEVAHRYRRNRDAAHVDGLLPEGPDRRRHLREPHAFILGLPLNATTASPLVVWRGSHRIMRAAFEAAYAGIPDDKIGNVDVTEAYQAARREVFATCQRVPLTAAPGQAMVLDRHLLHGVAPWDTDTGDDMRMVAYFRPLTSAALWR
ncbi:MAG: hypothetical protein AAFU41_06725 [Pseudomonadota bacterium]